MAAINVGEKFYAKNTVLNQTCGIRAGDQGYITFVGNGDVSFYLERRGGGGYIEGTCELSLFASNFTMDWRMGGLTPGDLADGGMGAPYNVAYKALKPYKKRFPDQFQR